jgi:polyhydroxybutyrate depolymerase
VTPAWRRFRIVASTIILLFLIIVAIFLLSYNRGRHSIIFDGRERAYYLHVPPSLDDGAAAPLLLVFHMRRGNAWLMHQVTRLNRLADREGFVLVYPQGVDRSWADGSGRYEAGRAGVDDVAFVRGLLAALEEEPGIDPRRVYVAGFSNGGIFALRLACEMPERLAGVATVSAVMAQDVLQACDPPGDDPPHAVPLLMIQGLADEDLPLEGAPGLASVQQTVQHWVTRNGCHPQPQVTRVDEVHDATALRIERYDGCRDGAAVQFIAIDGGGHKWPGGSSLWQFWLSGAQSAELDAGETLWRFFQATSGSAMPLS